MVKTIAWAMALYLSYCVVLFFLQRQIVFPRSQAVPIPGMADKVAGLQKAMLQLPFGQVESWFMPPESGEGPRPAIIFAHGNAELIDHWPVFLHPLARRGIGVLLVEYPGYGRSQGPPSQETIEATFVEAHDRLIERNDVDAQRVVFFGRSIGGGAVCALANRRKPAALVLMSAFQNVSKMALKFGVPGFFVRDPFDNMETVRSYDGPVLAIHGRYDDIIPYSHGQALAKAAPNGRLLAYDCAHNDCPPSWDVFYQDIESFLSQSGILKEDPTQAQD